MTREETKTILEVIDSTYMNFRVEDPKKTLDAWHFFLSDYDYNRIAIALKTYVATTGTGFPPSVDQLIAIANKPMEYNQTTEADAWALVYKALCNSGYNSREEFEKLPPLVQKAVGSSEQLHRWAIDPNFNHGVESSNFKREYNRLQQQEQQLQKMPVEMRSMIEQRTGRAMLNG